MRRDYTLLLSDVRDQLHTELCALRLVRDDGTDGPAFTRLTGETTGTSIYHASGARIDHDATLARIAAAGWRDDHVAVTLCTRSEYTDGHVTYLLEDGVRYGYDTPEFVPMHPPVSG